ncbi:hypothetical protein GWI33_016035 [Rhynchophorus ferrugineus]|uniref:Uncharacterized protein n=1 Tax=Rhynchophorus ferrugineus TaxID=354439 RepID=A0A834I4C1_RHYFE|nr:hypothetical protein GWI33_016035 [Rhynchophorus ferrugineus]
MCATVTKTETQLLKNKEKDFKEATSSKDLDDVINKVKKIDNICDFVKCKNKTNLIAIDCKFCKAVRREERREYMHPEPKLSHEKHDQAQTKLTMKLKQMQLERKSKQGFQTKGKKKK